MYSYEIKNALSENGYCIDSKSYDFICRTSPQINHIKYEPYSDYFFIDTNDDFHFQFKVYYKP